MVSATALSTIKIVDTDSHVIEPPDLWTSRTPAKYRDQVPVVGRLDSTGYEHWRVGDVWLGPTGQFSYAGSDIYPPESFYRNMEDGQRGAWNSHDRLRWMDDSGVHAQILYPNIIGFEAAQFMKMEPAVSIACTQAYNDFLIEWSSADPERLIPIAMVPFWDVDASLTEIKRAKEIGHRGVLFANKFEKIGLPSFVNEHWDPIYALCEELELSVNFHVGFGASPVSIFSEDSMRELKANWDPREAASVSAVGQMTNGDCIAQIIVSGLANRFPRLPFVSVESGMGYLPYLIESLDWHWKGYGAHEMHPGPLPSEIFRRQCYGTFWFERVSLPLLEAYPDNFMFETDYPHPTSLTPGPASPAERVDHHVAHAFADVDEEVARKALYGNAARVYHLN